MSGLARIQRDFQEFLLRQAPGIVDHVAGTERVPISTRLVEALQTNYPALLRLIGEHDFAQLASQYIAAHDSRHFSIRYYGDALAEFLATARSGDSFGDVCDATCRHFSEDEAPAHAAAFLRAWIEGGLITAVA